MDTSPPPAVEMIDAVLRFDGRTQINGITMSIPQRSILAVIGLDGSGKSALLNLMSTLKRPTSGKVCLFGKDTEAIGEDGRRALRLDIGVVFEEGGLLDGFTVGENVELPLARRGLSRAEMTRRADRWLTELQMTEFRDYLPSQLSLGLTRRAALARALAVEPRLLICDQVTTGVDLRAVLTFNRLFRRLRAENNVTIVLAVSDLSVIGWLADQVAVLKSGYLVCHSDLSLLTARRQQDPVLLDLFDDECWSFVFPSKAT